MQLHVLSGVELRRLLDMPSAIAAMRAAFVALSDGRARVPLRTVVEAQGLLALTMPGFVPDPPALGAKVVTVCGANRARGLPVVHAAVLLVDPESGLPSALLEGTWLTALRTGAASGLATDLLARPDASVLGVIGAGVQARTQVEAVRAVRRIEEVRVASRTRASAESLARELEAGEATAAGPPRVVVVDSSRDAASGADVVVTATDSATPVLPADAVAPGAHVNAVGGYRPDMQELPSGLVARARLVVDQVAAALAEAGDVVIPIAEGLVRETDLVELGAVAAGRAAGRRLPDEITVFKSVGSAAQDLTVAALALERARAAGVGTLVEL